MAQPSLIQPHTAYSGLCRFRSLVRFVAILYPVERTSILSFLSYAPLGMKIEIMEDYEAKTN